MNTGTLTVKVFKFRLGSFVAFPIFDDLVFQKWLVVAQIDQNMAVCDKYLGYMKYF